jgi:uncharacterized protein YdaU (DUF1376 family)
MGDQLPMRCLFVHDWLKANAHRSLQDQGALFRLECAYWPLGSLPADTRSVARVSGCMPDEIQGLLDELFPIGEDGIRHNADLDMARQEAIANKERAQRAAQARWLKKHGNAQGDTQPDAPADAPADAQADAQGHPSSKLLAHSSETKAHSPEKAAAALGSLLPDIPRRHLEDLLREVKDPAEWIEQLTERVQGDIRGPMALSIALGDYTRKRQHRTPSLKAFLKFLETAYTIAGQKNGAHPGGPVPRMRRR